MVGCSVGAAVGMLGAALTGGGVEVATMAGTDGLHAVQKQAASRVCLHQRAPSGAEDFTVCIAWLAAGDCWQLKKLANNLGAVYWQGAAPRGSGCTLI